MVTAALPVSAIVSCCSAFSAGQYCRQLMQCVDCPAVLSSVDAVRGLPCSTVVRCYSPGLPGSAVVNRCSAWTARQGCRQMLQYGPADDFLLAILPIEELLTYLDLGLSEGDLGITNVTLKVALKADIIFQEFSMLFLFNCPNVHPGIKCYLFFCIIVTVLFCNN